MHQKIHFKNSVIFRIFSDKPEVSERRLMRSTDQLKVPYFQPIDNGLLFLFSILSIFKLTQLIDRDIVATNFRQIAVDY